MLGCGFGGRECPNLAPSRRLARGARRRYDPRWGAGLRQGAAVRRKVKRFGETLSRHRPRACADRVGYGSMVWAVRRSQHTSEADGAIRRHAILGRERGPRAAPTLETGRALERLRGLPMVHRFADLRRIRPRPLSCRASHQVSFAEVPPSGLAILLPSARRNIVATADPGRIRCARILPLARRDRQQVWAPGHRRCAGASSSTTALRRPSGLDRHWATNACEGRSVVSGFGDLARTRPSSLILRCRLPAFFSGSSHQLLPQGAGAPPSAACSAARSRSSGP